MLHFSLFVLAPLLGLLITTILFLRLQSLRSLLIVLIVSFLMFQFLTEPAVFRWTLSTLPMSVNYLLRVLIYASLIAPFVLIPLFSYRLLRNSPALSGNQSR
ncbi:MAG: hypothetical protein RLZZ455_330 [Candidatus Parcubacteria bacterium]|jgi:hypothetical protein